MIKILLILSPAITQERQEELLDLFITQLLHQKLPFEIALFNPHKNQTDYEYALVGTPSEHALARLPNLKFVLSLNAGVEEVVKQLKGRQAVKVARLVNQKAITRIGQYVCWAVLEYARLFDRWKIQQGEHKWERSRPLYQTDITIGILGLGEVGKTVAHHLTTLGFSIKGFARIEKPDSDFEVYTDLNALMPQVNIVVNTLPLTDTTYQILNAQTLDLLPEQSCFINVGRGGTVQEDDLLTALTSEKLALAVLDVFCSEPLPENHPFWHHPKVRVTPHISGAFHIEECIEPALNTCLAFYEDKPLKHRVDLNLGY